MGAKALPPGFRFHPTDEELVGYYLKRKVDRLKMELEVIPEVELYKFDPWQLPDKSFLPKRDLEWFFFCSRDRKYPNGSRTNRATKSGYWKATGKDRQIPCHGSVTGLKKTLVFYLGRAPLGDRTDWVMHEYRLYDASTQGSSIVESPFALCRIVKRSEDQKTGDRPADAKKKRSMSSIMNDSNSIRMASNEPRQFSLEKSQEMNSHKATCDTSPRASTLHISEMRVDLEKLATPKTHTVTVSSDLSCNSSNTSKVQHSSKDQYVKNSVHMWQPGDTMGVPMFVFEGNYTLENLDVGACYSQSVLMPPCSGEFTNPQMSEYGDSLYQTFEIPEQHRDPSSQFMVTPSICRQASLDENFGEFFSLWLTEDSIAVT